MAKQTNFWYILVLTDNGAKFVTEKCNRKYVRWDEDKKPLEFSQMEAKEIAKGLMLNWHIAFAVCSPIELDTQPYRYSDGHFEWVENEKEVDKVEEK